MWKPCKQAIRAATDPSIFLVAEMDLSQFPPVLNPALIRKPGGQGVIIVVCAGGGLKVLVLVVVARLLLPTMPKESGSHSGAGLDSSDSKKCMHRSPSSCLLLCAFSHAVHGKRAHKYHATFAATRKHVRNCWEDSKAPR